MLLLTPQAIHAAQLTCEEYYMTDFDIPTIKIVGYEGLYGLIVMVRPHSSNYANYLTRPASTRTPHLSHIHTPTRI
jgi:hypothetical protein